MKQKQLLSANNIVRNKKQKTRVHFIMNSWLQDETSVNVFYVIL